MVKLKECCCGCTLRTGTLILAWAVLVWNCLVSLINLTIIIIIFCGSENYFPPNNRPDSVYPFVYSFVETIIVILVSIVAIWAVHKEKAKYLNGLFWYFCYVAIYYVFNLILRIVDPALEKKIAQSEDPLAAFAFNVEDKIPMLILITLFSTAITLYFALVVKSNRDYMLKNQVQINDHKTYRPDTTTIGYVNNVK